VICGRVPQVLRVVRVANFFDYRQRHGDEEDT
jgi:hypothetical protein